MGNSDIRLIEFPVIHDIRGNLTFIENDRQIPFEVKRVYYLYRVPAGESRAGHAHKSLEQVMIAISGSFLVTLDTGTDRFEYRLSSPRIGLHIFPGTWREISEFSEGAVCLVLASDYYNESDYYRNYDQFIASVKEKNGL